VYLFIVQCPTLFHVEHIEQAAENGIAYMSSTFRSLLSPTLLLLAALGQVPAAVGCGGQTGLPSSAGKEHIGQLAITHTHYHHHHRYHVCHINRNNIIPHTTWVTWHILTD
jgi:hypothetical protein